MKTDHFIQVMKIPTTVSQLLFLIISSPFFTLVVIKIYIFFWNGTGPEPEESIVISEDDFKIGDRVWVSGSKPGIIAFIGETQFAPGEWAGVVLDDPVGKNDGSVMGVRYFQVICSFI